MNRNQLLVAALVLMVVAPVAAQSLLLPPAFGEMPRTIPWTDITKTTINGTATFSGNRVYLRNAKGALVGTLVVGPGGVRTMYNASGKVIEERPLPEARK